MKWIRSKNTAISATALFLCAVSAHADPCSPIWGGPIGNPGADANIRTIKAFDDGSGLKLYAGGSFDAMGGLIVEGFARWDGSQWSEVVALSGPQQTIAVTNMAIFDDGGGPALYGSTALIIDGETVVCVAKWNGETWTLIGRVNQVVNALAVFDDGNGPALYVGGGFTQIDGQPFNAMAKWDGQTWSDVGGGVTAGNFPPVLAMEVFDDGTGEALYVGGWFTEMGGVPANRIAKWDGVQWTPLGSGVSGGAGFVQTLCGWDDGTGPALYVGGNYHLAGGQPADYIAQWDGQNWSALGSGTNSIVLGLEPYDDGAGSALFAGGFFTEAGGMSSNRIAKWDGSVWHAIDSPLNYEVYDFEVADFGDGPTLYISGQFMLPDAPGNRITAYRSCINGDFDLDRDVDISDFAMFGQCFNGPLHPPAAGCPDGVDADLDGDNDVDLGDFSTFSLNFTGPR